MPKKLAIVLLLSAPGWSQQILTQIAQSTPPISLVAPTLVQKVGCGGVSTAIVCTVTSTTAGNTLVIEGDGASNSCTTVTMGSDSAKFLLWTIDTTGGSNRKSILVARNITGGSTTATLNCTGVNSGAVFYEFGPSAGKVVAVDAIGSASGTGGTPSVTTISGVNATVEEVVASLYDNSNFRTLTAGSGYTMQQRILNSAHAGNCTTTCLGGSEDNNTKTGLSGTQTGSITGISTDPWKMNIVALANTPAQDAADTYIDFEGLSNTVSPTVAQLQASTHGVPGTWTQPTSANFTGATGSQGISTPSPHQIGALSVGGSGSLGLAYATGTVNNDLIWTFPQGLTNFSWIGQFQTSLPQNDTNLNAYTLLQINENGANDYLAPQIQANGSALHMLPECKSLAGSGSIAISTNTVYYFAVTTAPGAVQGVAVTSFTGTSGTLTFTNSGTNTFTAGQQIGLTGFTSPNTGLNYPAQTLTVLSAGLSSTTFEATVTGSGFSSGTGNAAGFHTVSVYDSTGTQVGSTTTCLAEPLAVTWVNFKFGVNGAEAESSGHVISFDNVRVSLRGTTLTP